MDQRSMKGIRNGEVLGHDRHDVGEETYGPLVGTYEIEASVAFITAVTQLEIPSNRTEIAKHISAEIIIINRVDPTSNKCD